MSRRELAVLDWFEDEAYVLTRVDVTRDEERQRSPPEAVEGVESHLDPSIERPTPSLHLHAWDYEEFRREHLSVVRGDVRGFRGGHQTQRPSGRRRRAG